MISVWVSAERSSSGDRRECARVIGYSFWLIMFLCMLTMIACPPWLASRYELSCQGLASRFISELFEGGATATHCRLPSIAGESVNPRWRQSPARSFGSIPNS
jgi:hypothetical protein